MSERKHREVLVPGYTFILQINLPSTNNKIQVLRAGTWVPIDISPVKQQQHPYVCSVGNI